MKKFMNIKQLILLSVIGIMGFSSSFAQNIPDSLLVDQAKTVYRNLEYNTISFNDLKQKWYITDPVFVREIFNKFVVNNAIQLRGKKPTPSELEQKVNDLYNGDVYIELRRRYYDDEIEVLRFFTEANVKSDSSDYFFDPVVDYLFIQEVLGPDIYDGLKNLFYSHTDLTKSAYDNQLHYSFDVQLNLFKPKVMFWSLTTAAKNKYLVSYMGSWGNDYIALPGWHYPAYFMGANLTYIDSLVNNEPKISYSADIGFGVPVRQPQLQIEADEFGQRLFYTGTQFFLRLNGNPLIFIDPKLNNFDFTLEFATSMSEFSSDDVGVNYFSKFYSARNYFVLFAKYLNIMNFMEIGWLNAGFGISTYEVKQYLLDPRTTALAEITDPDQSNWKTGIVLKGGINNFGGLLQHHFDLQLNYNFTEGMGNFGFIAGFTLSNTWGVEFKYFKAIRFTADPLPFYRLDNYIVFSPVIRINY